jgi:hypothetical protein
MSLCQTVRIQMELRVNFYEERGLLGDPTGCYQLYRVVRVMHFVEIFGYGL